MIAVIFNHPTDPVRGFAVAFYANGQAVRKIGNFPLAYAYDFNKLGRMLHVDSLWVLPGAYIERLARDPLVITQLTAESPACAVTSTIDDGRILAMKTYMRELEGEKLTREQKQDVFVHFAGNDERWGFQGIGEPERLLEVVTRLENALGVPLRWSPSHTGKTVMFATNAGVRASWLESGTYEGTPVETERAHDGMKKMPPTFSDLIPGQPIYVHFADGNYAYGASMTGVNVGHGTPIYVNGLQAPGMFNEYTPGVWLVKNRWWWTPELHYHFRRSDWIVPEDIQEAWIWPKGRYHQTLREYAERFWQLSCVNDPLVAAVSKIIRSQSFGLVARPPDYITKTTLYHPDWWNMVVSHRRAQSCYTIDSLTEKGIEVIWWNVDQIGVISNYPDWREAFRSVIYKTRYGVEVDRSKELGGYKHAYSFQWDDELSFAFSEACDFNQAHAIILAKEKRRRVLDGMESQETMEVEAVG